MVEDMDIGACRPAGHFSVDRKVRASAIDGQRPDVEARLPDRTGLCRRALIALAMGFGIQRFETRKMQDNATMDHLGGHSIDGRRQTAAGGAC